MRICDKDCCQVRSYCWSSDRTQSASWRFCFPWSAICHIRFNSGSWQRNRRNSWSHRKAVFGEITEDWIFRGKIICDNPTESEYE